MLTALGQRLENISDDRMARILLNFFFAAVIVSLVAWGVGVIEFRRPFLEWVSSLFEWVDSFAQNAGSEMFGAFLTFILLEVIRGSRERKIQEAAEEQRAEDLKELQRSVGEQLQTQMRGFIQAQEIARLRAAKTKEERQPILNSMKATGLLRGADLAHANLQGARLWGTNLQRADLVLADLNGAYMVGANLQGANLSGADLQEGSLEAANLQGADLTGANLQGANLFGANLQGALGLKVEQLRQAKSLKGTVLPEGTTLPQRRPGQKEAPWREAFEAWCETVETDEDGYIMPADHDDDE